MALSGDVKENYVELQRSTGERFESMARRMRDPRRQQSLDAAGRAADEELASWLEKQSDDEDAILRVTDPAAYERRQAEGDKFGRAPQGRNAQGGKQNG
jgi:hypothetical protein